MENERIYVIVEHGALHLDDVGIGYVGIGYGTTKWQKYVDEHGSARQGHVVWLDLWTYKDPSSSGPSSLEHAEVHAGQEIAFGGYEIKIIDIWDCGSLFQGRYCVRLLINPDGSQITPGTAEPSQTSQP